MKTKYGKITTSAASMERLTSGRYKTFAIGREAGQDSDTVVAFEFALDYVSLGVPCFPEPFMCAIVDEAMRGLKLKRIRWKRIIGPSTRGVLLDGTTLAENRLKAMSVNIHKLASALGEAAKKG